MGHWVKKVREHDCSRPYVRSSIGVGSEWRCRCGRTWRLTSKQRSENSLFQRTKWREIEGER